MRSTTTFCSLAALAVASGCGYVPISARAVGRALVAAETAEATAARFDPCADYPPAGGSPARLLPAHSPPPGASPFGGVSGLVAVRRVATCDASLDAAGIDIETGDGWAVDFGDPQYQGVIRATTHDLASGGHAHVTSVRLGMRETVGGAGPYAFAGIGFAMDWVSSSEFVSYGPIMTDEGSEAFPLGIYVEAGAGLAAGNLLLVAQFSASASLVYQETTGNDAGLTTWALSAGAGVTF